MIPALTEVLKRNENEVVQDALCAIGQALYTIVIPDDEIPSFVTHVAINATRPLNHGERTRIKVTLNEKGWDVTFTLDALLHEVAIVFIKQ